MKGEVFFSVANCILLFLYGLVWVWFSRLESREGRKYIYAFAALADFILITVTAFVVILSSSWTFSEKLFVIVSANVLFSVVMHKKSAN